MSCLVVLTCLPISDMPELGITQAQQYSPSDCDFCGAPVWVSRRGQALLKNDHIVKSCPQCAIRPPQKPSALAHGEIAN